MKTGILVSTLMQRYWKLAIFAKLQQNFSHAAPAHLWQKHELHNWDIFSYLILIFTSL
jgi:hypothetical protein